jgi:hypothetical protein
MVTEHGLYSTIVLSTMGIKKPTRQLETAHSSPWSNAESCNT